MAWYKKDDQESCFGKYNCLETKCFLCEVAAECWDKKYDKRGNKK